MVGYPNISVVSGILSVRSPSFSVVSELLSVVDIPPVAIPIAEKIQLLMYANVKLQFHKKEPRRVELILVITLYI